MERAFRRLERQVPPPVEQPWKDGFVLRYRERTIEQALIRKLARQVSGLYAIDALLRETPEGHRRGAVARVPV